MGERPRVVVGGCLARDWLDSDFLWPQAALDVLKGCFHRSLVNYKRLLGKEPVQYSHALHAVCLLLHFGSSLIEQLLLTRIPCYLLPGWLRVGPVDCALGGTHGLLLLEHAGIEFGRLCPADVAESAMSDCCL